jgi:RNA polymerase sigma factor (TIGR02999 family)
MDFQCFLLVAPKNFFDRIPPPRKAIVRMECAVMPSNSGGKPADRNPRYREALDDLFSVAYEELRRIASSVRRSDANATVTPSTLVNAAWLRLANSPLVAVQSELHFKRIAVQAMRQILVEAARRRQSQKRGGDGAIQFVPFDDSVGMPITCDSELLALDAALEKLAQLSPRQATLIEAKFFGGLAVNEISEILNVSPVTVDRDWRAARAWLASEIRRQRPTDKLA